jgi:hypothetical protein
MRLAILVLLCASAGTLTGSAGAEPASAAARMSAPGPEAEVLARDVGSWDVVATLRVAPDAKPIVTRGLVAERTLIGLYLQEVMKPAPGSRPDFTRIDYQTYSRVEARIRRAGRERRGSNDPIEPRRHARWQRPPAEGAILGRGRRQRTLVARRPVRVSTPTLRPRFDLAR